jgi:uncharacterized membrane protein
MVVYHLFFILNFLYGLEFNFLGNGVFELFASFVRFGFIFLVGISSRILYENSESYLVYVKKQYSRLKTVIFCSFLISLASFIFTEDFIFWGILHLISFSIVALVALPNWRVSAVFMILLVLGLNQIPFLSEISGFQGLSYDTLDYFPIMPWVVPALLGFIVFVRISSFLEKANKIRCRWLEYIGRKSLLIYMVHTPIIIVFLFILRSSLRTAQ